MGEVRVIIVYTDKLESISVDGIKVSDISPIQNLAIQDWFSASNGRDGWRGLIQEIRELVDDENVSLNFEFQGPEESKSIFEKCIKKLGYGTNGLSKKEIAKRNMDEAVRAEHRGLYNKAFKCYVNAADFGDSIDAKYMVAEYYYDCYKGKENGVGVDRKDALAKAIEYYEESANAGFEKSQRRLFELYSSGDGVKEDGNEALKWLIKMAENNDPDVLLKVGDIYNYGKYGININKANAFFWYEKSANQGNTDAMCELGEFYFNGYGVQKNQSKAFDWDKKAAELGNSRGQYRVGYDYEKGIGVFSNYAEAFKWYEKAANQGYTDAMCKLGVFYYNGYGVEKDLNKSFSWDLKAASSGSAWGQSLVGQDYECGIGVEKNYTKAVEYYKKSIDNGYAYSIYRLGQCYEKGLGVEKNIDTAFQWYKKGADKDPAEVNCCIRIGDYYYDFYKKADSSWGIRTTALVAVSVLVPITNWFTIPAALLGSSARNDSKKKKFLKTEAGQDMLKYYQKAAGLGNEHAKKRLEEFKIYL